MEFGDHYYFLLGIIAVIGLVGLIGNIQLASYYRRSLIQLQDFEGKTEFHQYQTTNHAIQEMVTEYTKHRSSGIEHMNTQAIIENKVFQQQLRLIGIFRLPIGVVEKVIGQLPSWSIIIGLLGTFSGLTLALFAMQGTLLQLGADTGTEVISVSTIVAAIAAPFKGMSFAFITSIAGIGMAFFLHVMHSGLLSKLGVGPSSSQMKHIFLTRCESFLDHHVQHYVQKQKPKDSLERVLDRLVDKVKESFDHSVERFGNEIIKMTKNLEGSIKGLDKVVQQSIHFTEQFQQGTSQLNQFGQVLETSIRNFQGHEEQVANRIEQLSKQIQLLQQELKQLTTKSSEGHQSLQKVVERSDQLMQQSTRKSEEVFQHFQNHIEEVQRRFQERFEEQQRLNKQNQDEWYYKYQEKNDQFSRAAESFGQAVQNLERQWADGLERFKREVSGQWGQLLEKYFGRQYSQGNQSHHDKELREVVRELAAIQLVLEREFQQIHRFSHESNQILASMYEWGRSQMKQSPRYNRTERYEQAERYDQSERYEPAERYDHSEPLRSSIVKERR
jgi:hypothetical protein